ncbi:MAG: helix-turn-helix domain-containing protein [Pseudomonadota bacterium]
MSKAEEPGASPMKSAGAQLRTARNKLALSELEVEERLNWLPGYVQLIEGDRYDALRRPTFARGYVQAYCKLLGISSQGVLQAFDDFRPEWDHRVTPRRIETRPLQLQQTGAGVVIGVVVMVVMVAGLWWWQVGAAG